MMEKYQCARKVSDELCVQSVLPMLKTLLSLLEEKKRILEVGDRKTRGQYQIILPSLVVSI
jgi:hypothetical protein